MKQRGFTIIEMMIVVVIALIAIMMVVNVSNGARAGNSISYGYNGLTESRCIGGYKFIVGQDGGARQIMDELGKGVKCQ